MIFIMDQHDFLFAGYVSVFSRSEKKMSGMNKIILPVAHFFLAVFQPMLNIGSLNTRPAPRIIKSRWLSCRFMILIISIHDASHLQLKCPAILLKAKT